MPPETIRVAVLAGGPDAERSISLQSGRAFAEALRTVDGNLQARVRGLGLDLITWPHDPARPAVHLAVGPDGARSSRAYDVDLHEIERLDAAGLRAIEADLVVPALHGPWGEGGPLQALLEADGRPFIGSGASSAALCMDKWQTKLVAQRLGVPTPEATVLGGPAADGRGGWPARAPMPAPAVVKPLDDGSSVDIRVCRDEPQLADALEAARANGRPVLVERYIEGRELTVGLVADRVNSVIEIVPENGFFDFEAKYVSDRTRFIVDPDLPAGVAETMVDYASRLYTACGCRDLARADFRIDDAGTPWLLEINTFPGFTSHSLVPLGAKRCGLSMAALCCLLVERAWRRPSSAD